MNNLANHILETLASRARHAALVCDDPTAKLALHALAQLDATAAVLLASELYGEAIAWLGPAFPGNPHDEA